MLRTRTRLGILAATLLLYGGKAHAQTARYNHTMTLLPDGNVLLVGGMNTAGTPLATVEVYRTTNPAYIALTSLPIARASHTATLLPDGRVLVSGGIAPAISAANCDAGAVICSVGVVFDPRTTQWTNVGAMQVPRFNHTATLLPNGRVLITGGQTTTAGAVTTDCDLFDPQTNSFTTTACGSAGVMSMERAGHTASLLHNGRVLAVGGYRAAGGGFAVTTEVYDPVANGWSAGPALIQARAWHSATQMGNQKVLIAGGANNFNALENQGILSTVEIFDANSNTISPAAPMAARKMHHTANLVGEGRVNIYGGLGNITTSYFLGSQVFESPSTLRMTPNPNHWTDATVNGALSSLRVMPETTLSVLATGRVVDGELRFSSPTVTLTDLKAEFDYILPPGGAGQNANASIDGATIQGGKLRSQTFTLDSTLSGIVRFIPQSVSASPDADLNINSQVVTLVNVPAGATINIASGTLVATDIAGVRVRVPFPASDFGAQIVTGVAIITNGNIARASSDLIQGFDIKLTSGIASIVGNPTVGFDSIIGYFADLPLTFKNLSGTVTNSTSTVINKTIDVSGIKLTSLTLKLFYVTDRASVADATFDVDITTVVIKQMIFTDQERYAPNANTWSFGVPGIPPGPEVFNHSEILLPNGDEFIYGGRNCASIADCRNFTYTARGPGLAYILTQESATPWTAVGPLNFARSNHTLTLLPDGKVLAAGGSDASGALVTSELFNPGPRTWSQAADMKQRRSHHTASLLTNGTVLAVGGFTTVTNSTGVTNHADIFYPDSAAWVPTAPMGSSRAYHSSVLLPDGNLLVMGGFANGQYLSGTEVFFSTGHKWVGAPAIGAGAGGPEARAQFTATLLRDGRILVVGGLNATSGVLQTSWLFNPQTWTWAAGGALNTRRHSHTATLLRDGRVIVIGGNNGTGEIGQAEIYNPATNTWTRTTAIGNDLGIPRLNHTATLLPDGKILIAGGFTALGGPIIDDEGFDVDFSSFQMQGRLPQARGDSGTVLLRDGFLLHAGGFDGLSYQASAEIQYYGAFPDVVTQAGGVPRRPAIQFTTPNRFLPGTPVTATGSNFKGVTEASGGGSGSGNSSHAHPRVYMSRIDGASSSSNDSGWMIDLTSAMFHNGLNSWQNMDSSLTFHIPLSSSTLPLGWYGLRVAANSQFSQSAMVQVGPPAPTGAPGVPSGTAVGASSVVWTWPAASGTFDGYSIYSATSGVFISTLARSGGGTESFLQVGLGPDTSSLIKIAAYNVAGDGQVVFATVTVLTAVSGINNLQGIAQSEQSIFWSWDPISQALGYDVFSATNGVFLSSSAGAAFTQTQLSTNTSASIRVRAIMPGGNGQLSASATTFTRAATPAAGQPGVITVTTGSFRAQWLANSNPPGTLYHLQMFVNGALTPVQISSIAALTADIPGLQANTPHVLQVAAFNGDGKYTGFTALGSTFTLAKPPIDAQITSVEPSALGISWGINGNPLTTQYQVLYSSDNFVNDFSTHIAFAAGFTSATARIGSLITGSNYTIRVTARNLFGQETSAASTQAFTDNGGGPAGSLSVLAGTTVQTILSGTLGNGRRLEMRIFPGAFESTTRIFVSSHALADVPAANRCGAIPARISIVTLPAGVQPSVPVEIGLQYIPAEVGSLTTLGIARFDENTRSCVPLESTVDTVNNIVYARTNHFTDFQLQQLSASGSVEEARVFPNPLYTSSQGYFTFDHIPANSRVRVFTLHGEEVFDQQANFSGLVTWRAENKVGRPVGSGIYLAVIESGGTKRILKLAVVR
ncbi:MAG: hypothetical protein HYZ75_09105 [Elusimicrobia bacterium]|nr:hypothetical protein [Elusimicrobiota bacterium]